MIRLNPFQMHPPNIQQIDFESILWLDKTENSYTNWAASEPSRKFQLELADEAASWSLESRS